MWPPPSFPQEHSVQDLVGPGPFTVLAPLSSAFDEEPRVSMETMQRMGVEEVWDQNAAFEHHHGPNTGDISGTRFSICWSRLEMGGAASQHRAPYQGKHSHGSEITTSQRPSKGLS